MGHLPWTSDAWFSSSHMLECIAMTTPQEQAEEFALEMVTTITQTISHELRLQTRAIVRATLLSGGGDLGPTHDWVETTYESILEGVYGPDAENGDE